MKKSNRNQIYLIQGVLVQNQTKQNQLIYDVIFFSLETLYFFSYMLGQSSSWVGVRLFSLIINYI